jgi:hypothetical protein
VIRDQNIFRHISILFFLNFTKEFRHWLVFFPAEHFFGHTDLFSYFFLWQKMISMSGNSKNAAGNKLYFMGNKVGLATGMAIFKFPTIPCCKTGSKMNLPLGCPSPAIF